MAKIPLDTYYGGNMDGKRKLTRKKYICPLCKTKVMKPTNHYGEIYTQCKHCGITNLFCNEFEAQIARANRPVIHGITLTYYKFNVEHHPNLTIYDSMCDTLRGYGLKRSETLPVLRAEGRKILRNTPFVSIYEPETFGHQYITNCGRLFEWIEWTFPNPYIREGYYLDIDRIRSKMNNDLYLSQHKTLLERRDRLIESWNNAHE